MKKRKFYGVVLTTIVEYEGWFEADSKEDARKRALEFVKHGRIDMEKVGDKHFDNYTYFDVNVAEGPISKESIDTWHGIDVYEKEENHE